MKKATRQHTKNHNTQLILKTIYEQGELSRADIARHTHLTRPTVSSLVNELMAENLVMETGLGPSAGGKRPTLLTIDFDAYQVIAADISSLAFRSALLNLHGDIIERVEFPVDNKQGQTALDLVYSLVEALQNKATKPLLGIAVGTPGLVDPQNGIIRQAVNLGWQNLPLKQLLTERYDTAVYIANDSQAATLAEYTFSAPRASSHLIVVKIGQGIGGGIVLHGQPFYGDGFAAGEIGHVVVADDGLLCSCGNRGCLETVASTRAILQQAADQSNNPNMSWEMIGTALDAGDANMTALITYVGQHLGIGLANLIAAFNIHHIFIAGRVTRFGDTLLQAIKQEAARRTLPTTVAETHIRYTTLGTDIVLLGCSAVILKHELGIV
ncbi:MAG: ROK family transcriptional regulator [Chloroflexi bacterium]|nr:ROK family transcriptional regulator [Chloroflexota bacterium]